MATFKTFVPSIALALSLIQVVNASAVKRWGVPLPACTPATPFVYAGCFSDTGSTDALEYRSELDYNNMTIEACVDFCKGNYLHSRFWLRTPLTRGRKRLQICRPRILWRVLLRSHSWRFSKSCIKLQCTLHGKQLRDLRWNE
jgi:hypothetical protein